ncbi:anti-sigma B factor antagonist [Pseudonocardia eucalypti]|nr:anti-sigma B factor antagonist [Pseudonocardia eucalypti]
MSTHEADPPSGEQQLLTVAVRTVPSPDSRGEAVVATVRGEVDMWTAPRLQAALDRVLRRAAGRRVVVDLLGVTFLDSAGLAALVAATRHAEQRHGPLRIVVDHNRPVVRPIQITDLHDVLMLCHTLEQALTL